MEIAEEVLEIIEALRNVNWDKEDEMFVRQISSLFNAIEIELNDVKMPIAELKSRTFILGADLEDVIDLYENDYLKIKEILNDYVEDLKANSILLTNEQLKYLMLKELFENE